MQEKLSKEEVGHRIKELRAEIGYSQAFIAKILGISRSNYSQIEIGNQFPTFDLLSTIASFYSKSYDWILHGHERLESHCTPHLEKPFSRQFMSSAKVHKGKIILVAEKSDYATHLNDSHYLNNLHVFDLSTTFLDEHCNYRAFLIEDQSVFKLANCGDVLIGKRLNDYSEIILNETYILITLTGITFCRIKNILTENDLLVCENNKALNNVFTLAFNNIQEIWIAKGKYSTVIQPAIETLENMILSIGESIKNLDSEVVKLNRKSK